MTDTKAYQDDIFWEIKSQSSEVYGFVDGVDSDEEEDNDDREEEEHGEHSDCGEGDRHVDHDLHKDLEKLSLVSLSKKEDCCGLCHTQLVRKFPCGHMFHMTCLASVTTCPLCPRVAAAAATADTAVEEATEATEATEASASAGYDDEGRKTNRVKTMARELRRMLNEEDRSEWRDVPFKDFDAFHSSLLRGRLYRITYRLMGGDKGVRTVVMKRFMGLKEVSSSSKSSSPVLLVKITADNRDRQVRFDLISRAEARAPQ